MNCVTIPNCMKGILALNPRFGHFVHVCTAVMMGTFQLVIWPAQRTVSYYSSHLSSMLMTSAELSTFLQDLSHFPNCRQSCTTMRKIARSLLFIAALNDLTLASS